MKDSIKREQSQMSLNSAERENSRTKCKVKIQTMLGDIVVRLYDETPIHRANFLKLAKEGYYDGTLFHRVIKDFMIQGGDPDSKGAPAGKILGVGILVIHLKPRLRTDCFINVVPWLLRDRVTKLIQIVAVVALNFILSGARCIMRDSFISFPSS